MRGNGFKLKDGWFRSDIRNKLGRCWLKKPPESPFFCRKLSELFFSTSMQIEILFFQYGGRISKIKISALNPSDCKKWKQKIIFKKGIEWCLQTWCLFNIIFYSQNQHVDFITSQTDYGVCKLNIDSCTPISYLPKVFDCCWEDIGGNSGLEFQRTPIFQQNIMKCWRVTERHQCKADVIYILRVWRKW